MKKKMIFFILGIVFFGLLSYFFVGTPPKSEDIVFGVNFSRKHSENLGLDWKENYLAILDDLKVERIKIITHWDLLEPERDKFILEDLDWQIAEAEKRNVKLILVVGYKTGRWPECHTPGWAKELDKEKQQERVLGLVEKIILRYRESESIWAWQIENEPFFPFGECSWNDKGFVEREISLARSLDPKAKIIFGDSGEASFWFTAAKLADIVGITMYKKVWFSQLNTYVYYPLPPVFYWRKALLVNKVFGKRVMVIELQAEPWGPKLLYDVSLKEQEKTMNLDRLRYNIDFAKRTGLDEFYLWGSEWWYWMKEINKRPEFWLEVKELFK